MDRIASRLAVGLASTLLLLPAAARAADDPVLADTRWTVEDIVASERANGWALSRDGKQAVYVQSTIESVDDEEKRVGNLRLCSLEPPAGNGTESASKEDEPACRPLTRGQDRLSSVRFSPDGRRLAYRSSAKPPGGSKSKPGQVWVLPLDGGAPWAVTSLDRSVSSYDWIDSDTLALLATESPSAWEKERKEKDDTSVVVEDAEREPPVRLYRAEIGGSTRRLSDNRMPWSSLSVSPDGAQAVVAEAQSLSFDFDAEEPPHIPLVDLATGEHRRLVAGSDLQPFAVQWAADSSGIYFLNARSNHPTYRDAAVFDLYFLALAGGLDEAAASEAERLPLHDWGLGGGYAVTADGVIALEAAGVRYRPVRISRRGPAKPWKREELGGEHRGQIDGWGVAPATSRVIYQRSTATLPPQWYVATLDGSTLAEPRQLTRLNPSWGHKPKGRVEVVRWTGALDEEVEGLLHYPLDWPAEGGSDDGAAEPRPLLLHIHGGPAGVDRDSWGLSWAEPLHLWRQRGAFVLQVNYHGSSNYGLDWVTSIEKRYYELEVPDIEAGVDRLIERGLVDPERMAATGWSNGGILSAALIAHTRRYKAASIGAADVEWISDWGNVDFGASFDNYYFGAPPWEIPQVYIDKSPFFDLPDVTTPSIVFTGTEDRNVPPHQSWSLFRAMQQIGKAPVRLVLFPGEPHSLRKPAHQRRKIEEELAWLEKYVLGEEEPAPGAIELPEAVSDSSPLAALVGRSRASRVDGILGTMAGTLLVPEVVDFRGLAVGRFEVTRAQWKAFEPSYPVALGESDLPVTGISLERAKGYALWLSERTGIPYRLPTVAEAEALATAAGSGGNTLARWTGGSANPDDRAAIAETVAELGRQLGRNAPLLLPVGSLPGKGDNPIFDLDGNAAEWATGEAGKGEAVGASADRHKDSRGEPVAGKVEPAPEYVGLRVVVGGTESAG